MKVWLSRGIGYYTVVSLSKAIYFVVVPSEDCRGNIVASEGTQEKSMK